MPRHYIDQEWDRDALFASRNLVSLEFAADRLKVSTHAVEKAAGRTQGALLMWIFGGRGQVMRKYRDVYVDMGPAPGPDLPHAWQGHSAEELLGEARKQHADHYGWAGLDHESGRRAVGPGFRELRQARATTIVCNACGASAVVPFAARAERAVYCSNCYQRRRAAGEDA